MIAWILIVGAGLCEVAMSLSLKFSLQFTQFWPSLSFLMFAVLSFSLLSLSLRWLPIGTAYAAWTGIGAAGTALVSMFLLGDSREVSRLICLSLIIIGVIGLEIK
jgi:quaternary ammonium compound-resistance protein SugE